MLRHESDDVSLMKKLRREWNIHLRSAVVDSSVIGLFGLELGVYLFEEHDDASRAMMIARLASAGARAVWSLIS
ncbi:hypothetical protein ACFVMC_32870 [Nocardia sp. NPDC127579]|uniref:hypothetical protein n=1 Tax=Nocardia sp. NPDC127579 TaxID=3345402 RepID=UPI00363C9827